MLMRTYIDFHAVLPEHREIDARLANWARWCHGSSIPSSSPMFRLYVSTARARSEYGATSSNIDHADASKIAKGVTMLPAKHSAALNWCYVKPTTPKKACQRIGVTPEHLMLLVRDARQMLINRNV